MKWYINKNKKIIMIVALLQILFWGLQIVAQLLLIESFDAAFSLDYKRFIFWTMVSILCWGSYYGIGIIQGYMQAHVTKVLNMQVRADLCETLYAKSYREFYQKDTGEYISWMTNDIKQVEKLAWDSFYDIIGRIAQIIFSIVALIYIDWSLLVAVVISSCIMWIAPKLFEKKMEFVGDENTNIVAKATSKIKEIISGQEMLKAYNRKKYYFVAMNKASENIESSNAKLNYTQNTAGGVLGFINIVLQIAIDLFIVLLTYYGRTKMAVLAGGSNLIGGITNGFDNIAKDRLALATSKPYFEKIEHHLENDIDKKVDYCFKNAIEVKDLCYSYDDGEKRNLILRNINLSIKKNKKYAIIGCSGAGKTTLLKIIMGYLTASKGTVKMDGISYHDLDESILSNNIAYISQDTYLFNASIRENILLGNEYSNEDIQEALECSALKDVIDEFEQGLDTLVGESGNKISGGQRQRIAIARALLHKKPIIIIDEGTSALDCKNSSYIEQKLLSNKNVTIIIVSHHLSEETKQQLDDVYEI